MHETVVAPVELVPVLLSALVRSAQKLAGAKQQVTWRNERGRTAICRPVAASWQRRCCEMS
jgi:hypothetical protein